MARTGVLVETENGTVKETSLGVITAAAGQEIYALVLDDNPADLKENLAEYGVQTIVSIKASAGDFGAMSRIWQQKLWLLRSKSMTFAPF